VDGRRQDAEHLQAGEGRRDVSAQTTHSPESPTAWASFATGVNAGKHNIYDFLVPRHGVVPAGPRHGDAHAGEVPVQLLPVSKPKLTSTRGGTSFWVTAGKQGVRSDMLTVPVTFPPEDVDNGHLLSGLPLPDIRGTMGTFSYLRDRSEPLRRGNTEMGGILKRLVFEGHGVDRARRPAEPDRAQQIEAIRRKARR
jgi:hypothetical protein